MEVSNSCSSYSSSSVDSTKPSPSESSVNLSLSLTFPSTSLQREKTEDWPPIKPLLRNRLKGRRLLPRSDDTSLFVKVYMEGIPIGRKLDLCSFSGYESLVQNLSQMFDTSIIYGKPDRKHKVLTYQDKDGDWMMVGDIPWENSNKTEDHETGEVLKLGVSMSMPIMQEHVHYMFPQFVRGERFRSR